MAASVRARVLARQFAGRVLARRCASSAASAPAPLPSLARGLFAGKIDSGSVFPYPEPSEDVRATLSMLVDPVTKFFETSNDAAANDESASVPASVTASLKELGAFGLQVPESLGGVGLNNTGYARMVEIVGGHDLGVGIYLGAHQSIGFKGITMYGSEEQKAKYLPPLAAGEKIAAFALTEPGAGSDAAGIKTRAVLSSDGKHWVINGAKVWISNGNIADVFTLFAKTEVTDEHGVKKDKMTAFIVERAFGGVTSGSPEKKMGIKCSPTAEVFLDNVHVPVSNVLGSVGGGFKIAMGILNGGRFGMGAALTGTMKTLVAGVAVHANNRSQFGKKLREFGIIQAKISSMAARLYATESLAYLLAANMDRGMEDYQIEAAMSKVLASDSANSVADEALQIMGGLGYMKALPYERWRRDVRIFQIFEGSNEILRQMIGLTGIQSAGKALEPIQRAMKSPLTNLGTLLPFGVSLLKSRYLGMHEQPSLSWAAPPLRPAADILEHSVGVFGSAVRELVMKHGKRIMEQQQLVDAVACASIDITSGIAALSRATRAHATGSHTAAQEVALANLWAEESKHRINAAVRAFSGAHSKLHKLHAQVAEDVFNASKYPAEHPLRL